MSILLLEGNCDGYGLLREENFEMIHESIDENGNKNHYIQGIFSEADVKLKNPRIYRKYLMERETDKFQEKILNKTAWMEMEHPESKKINPDRVCSIVRNLEWNGNKLYGKAQLLENDMGKKVLAFAKAGTVGVSSRSTGTVKQGYVQDDLNLITWDVVLFPSCSSAIMSTLYENQQEMIANGMSEEALYNFVKDIEVGKYYGYSKKDFNDAIVGRFKILMNKVFSK